MGSKDSILNQGLLLPGDVPLRKDGTLFLTYNRSSQQLDVVERIKITKRKMRGKKFFIKPTPPYFCKKNAVAILSYSNGALSKAKINKIGCNSWTCPNCNVKKALRAKYLIRDVIQLNKLGYFLTLTLDPKTVPLEYLSEHQNRTHEYLTKIFNVFLTSLRREKMYKEESVKFVWVIEFQQNGNAHMHILFNKLPYISYVRRMWVRVGGGLQMRVLKVESIQGISNYIGNYIVKGIKGNKNSSNTFNFFEKRFSISKYCIRPTNQIQELFPNKSLQEKYLALQSSGLEWIYNGLVSGEEIEVNIP